MLKRRDKNGFFHFLIRRSLFFLSILLPFLLTSSLQAQSFGGNPNRIKFKQIDNDTVRVVFPEGLDYWGQRVANLSMYQASMQDSSLSTPPIKTTIIIRNANTFSNGFVSYAPYRSEYFTTPPFSQFSGVSPWIDLLHVHEYRHILQESKVMVGRKGAWEHILFGQGGWSVVNYALLPDWYYEGDAVKVETLYTFSGRGRVPAFYMQIPALRSHGNKYSFEKMRSGSFKDPVPDHYVLGYHMTSFMEMENGSPAWDRITSRSIKKYAFISRSSEKLYGLTNRELYAETTYHLDSLFSEVDLDKDDIIREYDPKNFTAFELPKSLNDDKIIYLKNTYRSIPAFYTFDGEKEKKVFEPNMTNNDHWYDVSGNKLIWTEYVPGLIWQNESFSSLKIVDLESGKSRYLGKVKKKYFYPLWSENGEDIAVLELGENTRQSLVLLNKRAKEIKRLELEEGIFISAIIKVDSSSFWVVNNENEQSKILSIDIESGERTVLSPSINALIRHPIVDDGSIYFSTTVGIREQIVRLNIQTQEMEVMTDAPFRALDPMIQNGKLYYISYEGVGYSIRKKEIKAIEKFYPQDPYIAFYNKLGEGKESILQDVPDVKYETKKFKKSKELIQIHSWIPLFIPPNFGLSLLLQNKIGTFQGELTYAYNSNEKASQFSARVNYDQIYPKLFIGASYTFNRNSNYANPVFDLLPSYFYGRSWGEAKVNAGLKLPFYLSRGKWRRYLAFEGSVNYLFANYNEVDNALSNLDFPFENSRIYFYNLKKRSKRQIYSRWGQSIVLDQSQSFNSSISTQFYLVSNFFFPGIFKTHSFTISPAYKYEPIDNQYNFLDGFPASYGYVRYRSLNSFRILLKYTMPLWYPDIGIIGTAFFQRLYGSAFYDESYFITNDMNARQRSFGLELNLNMVLLRIFPFEIGVRGLYRIDAEADQNPIGFELLFYGFNF